MKKLIYIALIIFVTAELGTSLDFAQRNQDSSGIQRKERTLSGRDTLSRDRFIDNDGDGINDIRCGRGMGLGKGLGKHKCEPSRKAVDTNSVKKINQKQKGKRK